MVSGASRRQPGLGDLGGQAEVQADPANDARVLDGDNQPHAAATARAGEDVESNPRRIRSGHVQERGMSGALPWSPAPPAGMRGEDPVGEYEVNAGARDQGSELFQELQGLEEEVAGAVGPAALELPQDAAVSREPETVLGDRRAQQGAAELFQPRAIFCRHRQAHIEIEALEIDPPGPGRGDPPGVRLLPEAQHTGPGRRAGRVRRDRARE